MSGGNTIVFYRGAGKSEYVIHNQRKIHQKVFDALKTGDVSLICSTLMEHYMETINGYLREHKISAQDFPIRLIWNFKKRTDRCGLFSFVYSTK